MAGKIKFVCGVVIMWGIILLLVIKVIVPAANYYWHAPTEEERIEKALPPGSSNIKHKGGGWCTFELNGKEFLFELGHKANSITQIR